LKKRVDAIQPRFFAEFSLWKISVRAITPPIYWGPLVCYFPARIMFLRFSLRDFLRTCHVSIPVVMSKLSWTVGSLCDVFWHGFLVLFKSGQSFCTQKKSLLCMLKKYQNVLREDINLCIYHVLKYMYISCSIPANRFQQNY